MTFLVSTFEKHTQYPYIKNICVYEKSTIGLFYTMQPLPVISHRSCLA